MNWLKWLISIFRKHKPEPVKPEPVSPSSLPSVDIIAGGEDFRQAKETVKITAESSRAGARINYPKTGWASNGDSCNGFCCIVYRLPNGLVKGGKWDWLPERETSYFWDYHHLADGYKGHELPAEGAEYWVFICSINKQERSNGVRFVW